MGDAFEHARRIAADAGAGTLVHVGRFDLAEFALVLEPEEPLVAARRAFYAGMAALADALAAHAQPETLIEIHWPGALTVNLGLVGGGRLAWPEGTKDDAVPDWLVFGGMIRTASMSAEPGLNPSVTALEEEGFAEVTAADVVESFARNMMVHLDAWQEKGFGAVAKSYLERLSRAGGLRSIADNGDLLSRDPGAKETGRKRTAAGAGRRRLVRSGNEGSARMKLLRTIRLDPSDTFIFDPPAEPGEWAVSGAFAFWSGDPAALDGKARTAFRSGFLGVNSLGRSTLVQIVEASVNDRRALVEALAQRLVSDFGAPGLEQAAAAAEEEVVFAESLCDQPADTLIAVHRSFENGELREAFRTLRPRNGPKPARAFAFLDVEGEEEPREAVDLIGMAKKRMVESRHVRRLHFSLPAARQSVREEWRRL